MLFRDQFLRVYAPLDFGFRPGIQGGFKSNKIRQVFKIKLCHLNIEIKIFLNL